MLSGTVTIVPDPVKAPVKTAPKKEAVSLPDFDTPAGDYIDL